MMFDQILIIMLNRRGHYVLQRASLCRLFSTNSDTYLFRVSCSETSRHLKMTARDDYFSVRRNHSSSVPLLSLQNAMFVAPYSRFDLPNTYLYFYLLPGIAFLGCVGNLVTGALMARRWRRLRPRFIPFLFLCFSDSATLFVSFKNFASEGLELNFPEVTAPWDQSAALCRLIAYLHVLSNTLSCGLLTLAVVDCFLAVYAPLFHRRRVHRGFLARACCASVLIMALLSVATPFNWDLIAPDPRVEPSCVEKWTSDTVEFALTVFFTLFVHGALFAVVILVLNLLIVIRLLIKKRWEGTALLSMLVRTICYLICIVPKAVAFSMASFAYHNENSSAAILFSDLGLLFSFLFYLHCSVTWITLQPASKWLKQTKSQQKAKTISTVSLIVRERERRNSLPNIFQSDANPSEVCNDAKELCVSRFSLNTLF